MEMLPVMLENLPDGIVKQKGAKEARAWQASLGVSVWVARDFRSKAQWDRRVKRKPNW